MVHNAKAEEDHSRSDVRDERHDATCRRSNKPNVCFHSVSGVVLLQYSRTILNSLKYIGLYKFTLCMGSDSVLFATTIHRSTEIDWIKTMVRNGLVPNDFQQGEVFDLEIDTVQAKKRARDVDAALRSSTSPTILALYQIRMPWLAIELVRPNYEEYRGMGGVTNESNGETGTDGVNLNVLPKQNLLWSQAEHFAFVIETAVCQHANTSHPWVWLYPVKKRCM